MSKKPKLSELEFLFKNKDSFSLTEAQYEAKTGARLPKETAYLLNRSALSKLCKEKGFKLKLQEKVVYFERI